jgi:hypothetical protein
MINRMMANHSCLRSHLGQMDLRSTDTEWGTPIRDILGGRDWRSLVACCSFFRRSNLKI